MVTRFVPLFTKRGRHMKPASFGLGWLTCAVRDDKPLCYAGLGGGWLR